MSIAALIDRAVSPYVPEPRAASSPLFWSAIRAAAARLSLIVDAHRRGKSPACCFCNRRLTQRTATLEHLTPLSRGGTWAPSNLDLSCKLCNQAKGARTAEEYRAVLAERKRQADEPRAVAGAGEERSTS